MAKHAVAAPGAAPAIGPYSPAIRAGGFLYLSGQIPLDPATGQPVEGGIREQTIQVMENIAGLLEAAGTGWASIVKATVFLADMGDFAAMNEVYGTYLGEPYPARSTIQVARLPRDCRVEIEVVAFVGD